MWKRLGLTGLSLQQRLALALALAAAVPLLLAMVLVEQRQEQTLRAEALTRQARQAATLASAVEDYVNLHEAAVSALAAQPDLLGLPAAAQRAQLQIITQAFPDIMSTALFDAAGNQIRRSDAITASLPVSGYPVYELARRNNRPSLDILQSPVLNQPIFAFGAPVHDAAGNFAGLVVAALPATHMVDFMAQQNANRNGLAFLVDARGRVIAHGDAALVATFADVSAAPGVSAILASSQASGSLTYATTDGDQLAGYARVSDLGWTVIVARPAAEALAGLYRAQLGILAILAGGLIITIAAGYLLAGRVTAPIDGLLNEIRALATEPAPKPGARAAVAGAAAADLGAADLAPPRAGDLPEIVELLAAFREMQARLAARTAEREEEMSVRVHAEASLRQALAALSQHEEALRQANEELAGQVAAATADLRRANTDLERRVYERTQELRSSAESLAQANERLRMLYDIDQAILAARSPGEIAQAALDRIGQVIACDRASILIIDRRAGKVRFLATTGIPLPGFEPENTFPLEEWAVPTDLQEGVVHGAANLTQDGNPPALTQALLAAELRRRIQAPLFVGGQLIGSLNLLSRDPAGLPPPAPEIAAQVALSLAIAIQNAQLDEQVQASRVELQALNRRMVELQENERRAIARELHDEAGQALTTLMIGLGLIEREAGQPAAVLKRVGELKQTTDTILGDLHDLAVDLRPASLDRLGLLPALDQYIDTYRRQTGLNVALESVAIGSGERFAPEVETTIYRVVQEALTNVARHANATYAGVLVERRANALVGIVEDNGVGFQPGLAQESERLGLLGMRERAEMVGGALTIESAPGAGTAIFIEVPLR